MRPRRALEAFWRWEQACARRTRDIVIVVVPFFFLVVVFW